MGRVACGSSWRRWTPLALLLMAGFLSAEWLFLRTFCGQGQQAPLPSDRADIRDDVLRNLSARVERTELELARLLQRHLRRPRNASGSASRLWPNLDGGPPASSGVGEGGAEQRAESEAATEEETMETPEEQWLQIGYNESSGNFRRWRDDFQCGSRVLALPDGSDVQCAPGGDWPCCGVNGWCGVTPEECACPQCHNYELLCRGQPRVLGECFIQDILMPLAPRPRPNVPWLRTLLAIGSRACHLGFVAAVAGRLICFRAA